MKLKSITIIGGEGDQHPQTMKAFKVVSVASLLVSLLTDHAQNRDDIDFDNVEDMPAVQVVHPNHLGP